MLDNPDFWTLLILGLVAAGFQISGIAKDSITVVGVVGVDILKFVLGY